eukprot:TRINITY_DN5607_c0_g1_i2.p1 TRINITY_DN5607_c0_g1~~TRINITY_DN5607_c0_g1_i2.p1  ORF type:complete len:788 (+),score=164.97 TRINITY_DN5607_c0_g1_i2:66-2429(+)
MSSDEDSKGRSDSPNISDDGDAATVVVAASVSGSTSQTSMSQDDGGNSKMSEISATSSHQPLKLKSGSWMGQSAASSQHTIKTSHRQSVVGDTIQTHSQTVVTSVANTDISVSQTQSLRHAVESAIELSSHRSDAISVRSGEIELSSHRSSSPTRNPVRDDPPPLNVTTTPRRVLQISTASHAKPWSPLGPCASPKAFERRRSSSDERKPFTPVIDRNSKRTAARDRNMIGKSLLHGRDKEDYRQEAIRKEIGGYFKPHTAENDKSTKRMMNKNDNLKDYMNKPVFNRLYERVHADDAAKKEKQAILIQKEQEEFPQWKPCPRKRYSADSVRTPEARQQWHEQKNMKLDQIRSIVERNEVREMRSTPKLNTKSLQMAAEKHNRSGDINKPVEDRLIEFGARAKQSRIQQLQEEDNRCRDEASPHISVHAAMTTATQSAHERLYYTKNSIPSGTHGEGGADDDSASFCSDVTCTFQPAISKKSHILAGGDLPKTERVEDRLLRQGKERDVRNSEKTVALHMIDQQQRKGKQNVGPYSKLLNQLASRTGRKRSFSDPIGVNNSDVVAQLRAKHEQDLAFRPFVGRNSRNIDKQIHGDKQLTWEQRIGNLYFKAQEKESKLNRLRTQRETEETLQMKANGVPTGSSTPRNGGELHSRNKAWKQRLENKRRWGKHHQEEEEVRECTFKPVINKTSSIRRVGSTTRARSGSPGSIRSPKHVDFATSEMHREAFRHQAVASHIASQLSPLKSPLRATSLGTTYEDFEDDADRQELLRQLDFHRSQISLEERRV